MPQREKVVVATSARLETFLAMMFAQRHGEFEKENLEVDIQIVPPNDSTILLTQGQLDVVATGTSAVNFNAMAAGAPLRGVFPGSVPLTESKEGLWVRKEVLGPDGVFQPADLKGRKIATLGGNVGVNQAYMWKVLKEQDPGFQLSDLKFERIAAADMSTAVTGGAVDGGVMISPSWEPLVDDGCCVNVGYSPPYGSSFYAFGPTLLDQRPAVGQAFVRALARTQQTYLQGNFHTDPQRAAEIAEVLQSTVERVQREPAPTFSTDWPMPTEMAGISQDYLFQVGGILSYEKPLTNDQIYDMRFVDNLRAG
ncbi:ABC transporter substrate-binding protein [Pseudonocardia pini]|uniref:ABC transporter substrate-binding protein n=1 Tax=Pseudonocardia pini TaxID=2758030 RepID=UPI0015F06CA6|nr:ABC transporter substrate-binding protein [Pseudonocardia pini]